MWKGSELRRQVLPIEFDECSLVAHLVTVVGGTEDCDTVSIVHDLIALWLHLEQGAACLEDFTSVYLEDISSAYIEDFTSACIDFKIAQFLHRLPS